MKTVTGAARAAHTAGALASDYQGPDGATLVAGAAVLVPRDGGDLRAKVRQAAAQGAAAVLLYGASDLPAGALGGDDRTGIPALELDGALGLRIAQAVAAGQQVTFTAGTATYAPNAWRDAVAPFSSEGLGWDDRLKPDVVLPGVAIIGAEAGGGYAAVSGTSVAAAQAAGLVAVLAAQHADWSAARLRSALISTAVLVRGLDAPLAPVQAQGGGRPDTATASVVTVATRPASLSLGRPGDDGVARGELTVENLTDAARTLVARPAARRGGRCHRPDRRDRPGPVRARAARGRHAAGRHPRCRRPPRPSASPAAGSSSRPTPGPTQRVPLAVALPGAKVAPIRTATLAPGVLSAGAKGTLSLALGSAAAPADGSVQLAAVRQLTLELYRGEKRLAVLYTARDLLPGRYTFAIRPVGAGGTALADRPLPRRRPRHRQRRRQGLDVAAAPRAMTAVALYWAQGCHLCEPAKQTARAVCADLGVRARGDRHHGRRRARGDLPRGAAGDRDRRAPRLQVLRRRARPARPRWRARWPADSPPIRRTISASCAPLTPCGIDGCTLPCAVTRSSASRERNHCGIRATDSRRRGSTVPLSAGTDPDEEDGSRRDLLAGDRGVHPHQRHPDPP